MKKTSLILIIIGLVLVVAALAVARVSDSNIWEQFSVIDERGYQSRDETVAVDEIKRLVVDIENDNLLVRSDAADSEIRLEYYTTDKREIAVETHGDELSLIQAERRQWWQWLSFGWRDQPTVIHLPADLVLNYDLAIANGRIEMSELMAGELNLRTQNGQIVLSQINAKQARITGSNGQIKLSDVAVDGELTAGTSNGEIILDDTSAGQAVAETANGRIGLSRLTSPNISLKTSNGIIEGSIVGREDDYKKDLSTSLGRIAVGDAEYTNRLRTTTGENSLTAKTSNGAIQLEFLEK
jgi:hypothetical protein